MTWYSTLALGWRSMGAVGIPLLLPLAGSPPTGTDRGGDDEAPSLAVGTVRGGIVLDGVLTELEWGLASRIDSLTMVEPVEGGRLVGRTRVWVLADARTLIIGIQADDPNPSGIVSYSKIRDPELRNEDHIKVVLDPFLDGRSGYVFAVNPGGARYDALVSNRGEDEDEQWDAVWEAATRVVANGWSAEIRIPIQSLTFDARLRRWGFNVERRVERLQEVSRWASPIRDAKITQTSRAGLLTELPDFSTGVGLTVRPTLVGGFDNEGPAVATVGTFEPSLDLAQRLGSQVTAIATVNTDFAETEVDTRQTNLTRFAVFFPEKRTFFLEGSDIFDFGIGLSSGFRPDFVPFFSRRIGLYEGEQVPLLAGGKVNGKVGNTNFGGLVTHTRSVEGLIDRATMGAVRVKQNVFEESSLGMLATFGDPEGVAGSYLIGSDFTYQTSRLGGDKNFLVGVWGLVTGREGLSGDRTAFGAKIDYPNDTWDVSLTYKRVGDGFDPSLGFVQRAGVHDLSAGVDYTVRPGWSWVRLLQHEFRPTLVLDLDGAWETYRVFTAPINWRFESGERLEFNVVPQGERLIEPFEITDSVVIAPGSYHFVRYRLEADIAAKRKVSGRVSWWFGGFYDGSLDQFEVTLNVNPSPIATLELNVTRNTGDVSAGRFTQDLVGGRVRLNISPDLAFSSYLQYDNESREIGSNTRLRWTFDPLGDLFVVYNHNVAELLDRWELESSQLLVKIQYAFRY